MIVYSLDRRHDILIAKAERGVLWWVGVEQKNKRSVLGSRRSCHIVTEATEHSSERRAGHSLYHVTTHENIANRLCIVSVGHEW